MSTDPDTAAAETTPAPPEDLCGPDAGGETAAAPVAPAMADGPESQLPGPAPEGGTAGGVPGGGLHEGSPAADEAAAGPGSPGCPVCGAQVPAGAGFYAGYGTLCADIAACTARLERAHQDASPDYSYSVLLAALAAPGPTVTVPSWDDLRKRGADECGMWAGITDTMIAAGHASDPVRRYRAWYGREPARAAA